MIELADYLPPVVVDYARPEKLNQRFGHMADAATPSSRSVDNNSVDKLFQERFTSLNHLSS
jgi:hypothetical protein